MTMRNRAATTIAKIGTSAAPAANQSPACAKGGVIDTPRRR